MLWLTGILAGLLPDVDSDHSASLKVVFNTLGVLSGVLLLAGAGRQYPLLLVWAGIIAIPVFCTQVLKPLCCKLTVHRGNWHSLLTAVFLSVNVTIAAWYITRLPARVSWLAGIFMLAGFLTHLLLDEMYAVDVSNLRLKRSFGSACKLFSRKTPVISAFMVLILLGEIPFLPPEPALCSLVRRIVQVHWFSSAELPVLSRRLLPRVLTVSPDSS